MFRILHTGDLHLGRKYTNQEAQIAEKYQEARIRALHHIIRVAEEESCDYIVVAGDLFDTKNVSLTLIRQVCEIFAASICPVIVLPGNHDFYEGEEDKLWNRFQENASDNTTLLTANVPVAMEGVVFYPCICFDKHSEKNVIGWIKNHADRDPAQLHIGVAHGAIEGLSFDREKKYYYMTKKELEESHVDLWLIGHTHVAWPEGDVIRKQKVFNAGTHQQTDIADASEGSVFVIDIDDQKNITARKIHTGVLQFCRRSLELKHGQSLRDAVERVLSDLEGESTSVRLQVSGVALAEDFDNRYDIYKEFEERFVKFEPIDGDLQPEITEEMIDTQTMEGSLENQLLKKYIGEPEILNLAFDLVKRCKED